LFSLSWNPKFYGEFGVLRYLENWYQKFRVMKLCDSYPAGVVVEPDGSASYKLAFIEPMQKIPVFANVLDDSPLLGTGSLCLIVPPKQAPFQSLTKGRQVSQCPASIAALSFYNRKSGIVMSLGATSAWFELVHEHTIQHTFVSNFFKIDFAVEIDGLIDNLLPVVKQWISEETVLQICCIGGNFDEPAVNYLYKQLELKNMKFTIFSKVTERLTCTLFGALISPFRNTNTTRGNAFGFLAPTIPRLPNLLVDVENPITVDEKYMLFEPHQTRSSKLFHMVGLPQLEKYLPDQYRWLAYQDQQNKEKARASNALTSASQTSGEETQNPEIEPNQESQEPVQSPFATIFEKPGGYPWAPLKPDKPDNPMDQEPRRKKVAPRKIAPLNPKGKAFTFEDPVTPPVEIPPPSDFVPKIDASKSIPGWAIDSKQPAPEPNTTKQSSLDGFSFGSSSSFFPLSSENSALATFGLPEQPTPEKKPTDDYNFDFSQPLSFGSKPEPPKNNAPQQYPPSTNSPVFSFGFMPPPPSSSEIPSTPPKSPNETFSFDSSSFQDSAPTGFTFGASKPQKSTPPEKNPPSPFSFSSPSPWSFASAQTPNPNPFEPSPDPKDLPLCVFGKNCYRKNPQHFVEFHHPPN